MGLGHALIRYIPQSGDDVPVLVSRSLAGAALASLVIGLVFMSSLALWSQDLSHLLWQGPGQAVGFLAFVVFTTLMALLRSVFVAFLRSGLVLALVLAVQLLRFPLPVALGGLGWAFGIVSGQGVAALGGILLATIVFLPRCLDGRRLPLALDVWKLAPMASFALSNFVSNLFIGFSWLAMPLLVIALVDPEAAGFFFIAWTVSGIVLIMTQQLALSLFAEGSHESQGFEVQARGALLAGVGLGGLFAVGALLLGDQVLRLFGGEYAEQSSIVLRLLAAASPMAAVTNIYLGVERVRGRMVFLVLVSAVVAVVMLGVTIGLTPRLGIEGAGYGVLAGYGAGALLSLFLLYPILRHGKEQPRMS